MEDKHITELELAELKTLQGKFAETLSQFGRLAIDKMTVESSEQFLKKEWAALQTLHKDYMDKLVKSYGPIVLNMETGTFTGNPPESHDALASGVCQTC